MLVIADDLTGAIEVGAQFAKHSVGALVTPQFPSDASNMDDSIRVLVVDTDSRNLPSDEAAQRVRRVAAFARESGIRYVYKKTDSTLRGNIADELSALCSAFPGQPLIYIPAYPRLGRTCKNGHLCVNGERIAETPIPGILKSRCHLPVKEVADSRALENVLEAAASPAILVCDGETDEDLAGTAEVLRRLDRLQLTAGPAGFTEYLAQALNLPQTEISQPPEIDTSLTVCGSLNMVSLTQVRHAEDQGFPAIGLTPEQVMRADFLDGAEGRALIQRIIDSLSAQRHLILRTIGSIDGLPAYLEYARSLGIDEDGAHRLVAQQNGCIVRRVIEQVPLDGLIVFGGDTAKGVLQDATITPVKEVVPGIPMSKVALDQHELCLVTKAGGFGSVEVLAIIKKLICQTRNRGQGHVDRCNHG